MFDDADQLVELLSKLESDLEFVQAGGEIAPWLSREEVIDYLMLEIIRIKRSL